MIFTPLDGMILATVVFAQSVFTPPFKPLSSDANLPPIPGPSKWQCALIRRYDNPKRLPESRTGHGLAKLARKMARTSGIPGQHELVDARITRALHGLLATQRLFSAT